MKRSEKRADAMNDLPSIRNRDIIVTSLQAWDIGIGSNCKDIARQFAEANRVLYVNSPLDRFTIWKHRDDPFVRRRMEVVKGRTEDLIRERNNMWILYPGTVMESISRLPWNGLFDRINRVNNARFAREITSAADRLGFRDYILFNDGNMFRGYYLKEMIRPKLAVYYSRDNFMAMDYWKTQGRRMEPSIMKKYDMVLSNSDYLTNVALKNNPHSYNVGSGCDFKLYDRKRIGPVPEDLERIPKPVIGYTGALLSLRLDEGLIRYIAEMNPGWSIVLIGPQDHEFRKSGLHSMKNVYFLGSKSPDELPSYINGFDVAFNPQKVNEVTIGNYPRKIDEYLALGRPVVATKTEAMAIFSDYTYLAGSKEEFVSLIRKALEENTPGLEQNRTAFALTHSWENNVEGIYRKMKERLEEMDLQ